MRTALVLIAAGVAMVAVGAQAPQRDGTPLAMTGSAIVTGTVVADDDTRAPLRRVTVTLSRAGIEDIRKTSTDDQGWFQFGELPSGTYTLGATKGGYITKNFGAPQPGMPGSSIALVDGQRFAAAPIALIRGAVIAGRLLDRGGRPVSGLWVQAAQFVVVNGERRRRSVTGTSGSSLTNAHGDYRVFGLMPGEYLVYTAESYGQELRDVTTAELRWAEQPTGPAPAPGRAFSYAPTMYPGTADAAGGTPIPLARGEERAAVDFSLQYVPASRVSGVVTGPDGRPAPFIALFRTPKQANQFFAAGSAGARTGADGAFVLTNVPPGEFALAARGALPGGPGTVAPGRGGAAGSPAPWGLADLNVSGQDVTGVSIRLQPGMSVTGQVAFKSTAPSSTGPPVDLSRVQVRLLPQSPVTSLFGSPPVVVAADGTFKLEGLMPGAFRLMATVSASSGATTRWLVKSAMLRGQDVIDIPFEVRPNEDISGVVVTFSDAQTELSGSLLDGAGLAAPQLYVFAFPVDRSYWVPASRRIGSARSSATGVYAIAGLPPGDYYLCALRELDTTMQYDPTYLEQFVPASIKISLIEGEKKTQHLRVGG